MVENGLIKEEESLRKTSDPLLWLLHGPPGTGKSHVLGFVTELFEMMGYTYGLDYEVAAFQAVNAADLQGKTIHGAFGWKQFGGPDEGARRQAHTHMAHWRWLILDEISMVDGKLLAQAEKELRDVVPVTNPWKIKNGLVRPFAGVNVIFTGDFHSYRRPRATTWQIYLAQSVIQMVRWRPRMPWASMASFCFGTTCRALRSSWTGSAARTTGGTK